MNKFLILISIVFIVFLQNSSANTEPSSTIKKKEVLVGYYGRPNTPSLGILGENNIDELIIKMKEKELYFKNELDNKVDIKLAFHIIHSLATRDPGRRNDYLLGMSEKTVMKYIKRANKEGFAVILDVQLGTKTAFEAVQPILKYLKYDNVHLAIDPEFKIPTHRRYPPGKYVGHIFADDLNKAQESISNYLIEHNVEEKRNLIVHMFHKRMLRKKEEVKNFDNLNLIYNIDGHGNAGVKIKIYNGLYATEQTHKAIGGFKIFYNSDTKPIMTPKEILGLQNVGSQKIMVQPYYINYH